MRPPEDEDEIEEDAPRQPAHPTMVRILILAVAGLVLTFGLKHWLGG